MARRTKVIQGPGGRDARLRELGLTQEHLRGSLNGGLAAAALTSVNHPPNFGGTTLWAEAVRILRELLIPLGWRRDNSHNFPTVVSPDRTLAIAIARGDEITGDPNPRVSPTFQYSRGVVTERAVERNRTLPFDHLPEGYGDEPDAIPALWFLLHRRVGTKLLCELSYPTEIESGFVITWGERIILDPIDLDPTTMPVLDDEPVNPEITVKRRG